MARTSRKHTFTVIKNVYRESYTSNGTVVKRKLIKKDAKWEIDFYLDDIVGVQHVINLRGNVRKNVCEIMHRDKGDWIVEGSKEKISAIIFGDTTDSPVMGFKK